MKASFLLRQGSQCLLIFCFLMVSNAANGQSIVRVDGDNGLLTPTGNPGDDWNNAFRCLADALAFVGEPLAPVQIWVRGDDDADGVIYRPDQGSGLTLGDQSLSFHLRNFVEVYGGFEGDEPGNPAGFAQRDPDTFITILSGDLDEDDGAPGTFTNMDDNSYHVVRATNVTPTAVLDGFTIKGGNALIQQGDEIEFPSPLTCDPIGHNAPLAGGGGLDCVTNASPRIVSCIFRDNLAVQGGAIRNACNCHPVIVNCRFILNQASVGGAIYNWLASAPFITNSLFLGNHAGHAGGAIGVKEGGAAPLGLHLSVINCVFYRQQCRS